MSQPLKLWAHVAGPNPFKVMVLLRELGLNYETTILDFSELKQPSYESKNPNGRLPALEDPNTGLTIWESGSIIQYIIEKYDKDHKFSFASEPERWAANNWLHFQMSGQGPYFGQATWFRNFHPEKLPSALERYENEIRRVTMILDRELKGKEYLVGGRVSYADLAFTSWYWVVEGTLKDLYDELQQTYPSWGAWYNRLDARPVVGELHKMRKEGVKNLIARNAVPK